MQDCAAAGYPVSVPALSQALLVGWTHNINSKMVNEAARRLWPFECLISVETRFGTVPTGVADAVTSSPSQPSGLLSVGTATNLPQSRIVNTCQAQDNLNYVMGKHQIKAGVNYTFSVHPMDSCPP